MPRSRFAWPRAGSFPPHRRGAANSPLPALWRSGLNSEGRTSGELAWILKAPRSKVSEWLSLYQRHGVDGLLEGYRSGRPSSLTAEQRAQLGDILESGPVAYGLDTGIWTSPMLAWVIAEEFGVTYHPGHVRKLLHQMGFSVQRPRRVLARADAAAPDRRHRRTYPHLKKKIETKTRRRYSPMKPVFDRTPRCMPPGVGSGTRRKSPSRESARASRFWAPSNCGALVSITGRTRSSTQTPTWAFWSNWRAAIGGQGRSCFKTTPPNTRMPGG